jgi:hypothetical protein
MGRARQFNAFLSKRAGHQESHYWQRKLRHRASTTHVGFIAKGIKQIGFIIGQGWEQIFIVINHQPNITTFKNATVTKTAIKQASAFNETSTEPVTCIRAARKQGSLIIRKGTAIKNVIKSGSTSAQEIMAHNPWLASETPSSKSNNHPPSAGAHAQWSNTKAEGKIKTVVLDVGLDIKDLENGMRLTVRKQPAWVMYDLGDLGTDNCQPPIEITARLDHGHQAHPKKDTSFFGQEAHAHQSSLEIIAMLYWGPCHLQHAFLRDHSIKQTSGILATAATRYSFITSCKRKYPQTPFTQAHPITCTAPWKR